MKRFLLKLTIFVRIKMETKIFHNIKNLMIDDIF